MLIGIKNRFIFIANSKTASTSLEKVLTQFAEINRIGSPKRKHISWQQTQEEYKFLFDIPAYHPKTFFRFGVVREPADWVISWYNYRRYRLHTPNSSPKNMTFEQFWQSDDWVKKKSQKNHFCDSKDVCEFDLIIPYEKISQAFPVVINYLKLNQVSLPYKNKSFMKKVTRSDFSSELIDEINVYYQNDFDFWKESLEVIDSKLETLQKGREID